MHVKLLGLALLAMVLSAQSALASSYGSKQTAQALYPVSPLLVKKDVDSVYPSVAGDFMVFNTVKGDAFRVERVSKHSPDSASRSIKPMIVREAIRFGVAVQDGSVGYVSNRSGPLAAWMWMGSGESHVAIGHNGSFGGNIPPNHLNASADGKVWCYDSSLQKLRRNMMLSEFTTQTNSELIGQLWRAYDSDSFRHKMGYRPTESGKKNDFSAPVLYVFNRNTAQLNMIPNAFDATLSPDGRNIVFVRETKGNYDLWMQTIDGEELLQLTDSKFGDFEPQFSPDGRKLLFVSNRDYAGAVTKTSIYMMDLKKYQIKRLTNAKAAVDGSPAWLDDHRIVFHSNRSLKKPQAKTTSHWNLWQLAL